MWDVAMNKTEKKGKLLKARFTAPSVPRKVVCMWSGGVPSSFLALVVWLKSEARSMVIRFEVRSWL